jgi:hypothetical protein
MQLANLTVRATGVCVDELGLVVVVEPGPAAPLDLEGDAPQAASDNGTTTSAIRPAARRHGTVRFLVSGGPVVGTVRPLSFIVFGKTCEMKVTAAPVTGE